MDLMELDVQMDKLRRVNRLKPGDIFGHHSYLLDRPRTATLVGASDVVELMRFEPEVFQQTSSLLIAKNLFTEHKSLVHQVFPRLRDDQTTLIAAFSDIIALKAGTTITSETTLGRSLYIVKVGTIARFRVVDFTHLSFRTVGAPFEGLQLHFPDGFYPVHTDNLEVGSLFADPSIEDFRESMFNVRTSTEVELLALNVDYFRIVAGAFEVEHVKQEMRSDLTDEQVIKIWVAAQRERLWDRFKGRQIKDAHREIKTERQFKASLLAIRVPKLPGGIRDYRPKKVVPYVSKSLRGH